MWLRPRPTAVAAEGGRCCLIPSLDRPHPSLQEGVAGSLIRKKKLHMPIIHQVIDPPSMKALQRWIRIRGGQTRKALGCSFCHVIIRTTDITPLSKPLDVLHVNLLS